MISGKYVGGTLPVLVYLNYQGANQVFIYHLIHLPLMKRLFDGHFYIFTFVSTTFKYNS